MEFLYADDLVLLGKSWKDVGEKYVRWKSAPENKGLKVNVAKGMLGTQPRSMPNSTIDPCFICG